MAQATNPNLIIAQKDSEKLSTLIQRVQSDVATQLEVELERARIVADEELPEDVVCMNSEVSFVDLDTKKESSVTLVYPQHADIEKNKISILAPVGAALIGLRVGQTIDWPLPNGKVKRLKVTGVKMLAEEKAG